MTGESDVSAVAILEYFKPLSDFLDRENAIKQRLMDYKDEAIQECNFLQLAEWASAVDVENEDKDTLKAEAVLKYAEFAKATAAKFSDLKVDEIGDELSRRQVNSLQTLDTDILNVAQLTEVGLIIFSLISCLITFPLNYKAPRCSIINGEYLQHSQNMSI